MRKYLTSGRAFQIQLSHPLSAVGEDGPFQRIVVIVPYGDNESLKKIEEIVVRRNCRALNGHVDAPLDADMDPQMLKKSLSTVGPSAASSTSESDWS